MARSLQEIATELVATGLDQRQLTLLLELVMSSGLSSGLSSGSQVESADDVLARRREYERNYKRKRRLSARLVSTQMSTGLSSGMSTGQVDMSCNLKGTSEVVSGIREEVRKKNTEGVIGRASVSRGTRLSSNSTLSDADRKFALDNGVSDPDRLWAEFIDYWIGVPGQRGTKLNWSATWRNRVRAVSKGGLGVRAKPLTAGDRAREFARQIREIERAEGIGRPPAVFGGDGPCIDVTGSISEREKFG